MVHLQLLGFTRATAIPGIAIAVYLIVRLIATLGGRFIPFFTEKGIAGARTRRWTTVEYVSMGSLIALMVLDLMGAAPIAVIVVAKLTAIGRGIRLFGWYLNPASSRRAAGLKNSVSSQMSNGLLYEVDTTWKAFCNMG